MKCSKIIVLLVGWALVLGFSVPVLAGPADECVIEINALRGGSPTVPSGGTKDITSKARIAKGTSAADATVTNTTLTIYAYAGDVEVDSAVSAKSLTLVVGKGGQGDKLTLDIPACNVGDPFSFVAMFEGTFSEDGSTCNTVPCTVPN